MAVYKPYMIRVVDINGEPCSRWIVLRNRVQYMFANYSDAIRFYNSHA